MKALGSGSHATIDALIGGAIKQRRKELGLRIEDMAYKLSVSPAQIELYESGSDRVGAEALITICIALDVPPSYFFDALAAAVTKDTRH